MKKTLYSYIQYVIIIFSLNCGMQINSIDASITNQVVDNESELKILSWNIKMFPGPYGWFLNQSDRQENINRLIIESKPYDIIFFQEAFSDGSRKEIYSGLQNIYPYSIEPDDNTSFYKLNSGLWVISRLPIVLKEQISFTHRLSFDKLSSKGAKLFSVIKNKQEFYFIHTHMQSNNEKKYMDVREKQYTEIHKKLITPYAKQGIPIILLGDLNISESNNLESMLKKLELKNGPIRGVVQHSIIGTNKLVDYILVKSNDYIFNSIKRRIVDFSNKLNGKEYNLSDHYPIEGIFNW